MARTPMLVAVIDLSDTRRNALVAVVAKAYPQAFGATCPEQLPEQTTLIVVHVRALFAQSVFTQGWLAQARHLPLIVVADTPGDERLVQAARAGLVHQVVDPWHQEELLRRMIAEVAARHRQSRRQAQAWAEHTERLEDLETQLAMLRLDQQAGAHVQRKLLPTTGSIINGVRYEYCLSPSLYLSGDFLDFQRHDERYSVFYFADVSGHGASSAFVTVLLKYLYNRWLSEWDGQAPERLAPDWLARLNAELLDSGIGKHLTLFVGVIDRHRRQLHYSLGAQMPMPRLDAGNGEVEELAGEGMPVGLFPEVIYPAYSRTLPTNFRLWLCSDGVLECLPEEGLQARNVELSRKLGGCASAATLYTRLMAQHEQTDAAPHQADLPDDLTIMMLSGFDHDSA